MNFINLKKKQKFYLISPVVNNRKGEFKKEIADFIKKGFMRFRIDGKVCDSSNIPQLDKKKNHSIDIIVDRIEVDKKYESRIAQSIEAAISLSDGVIYFYDVVEKKKFYFFIKICMSNFRFHY